MRLVPYADIRRGGKSNEAERAADWNFFDPSLVWMAAMTTARLVNSGVALK